MVDTPGRRWLVLACILLTSATETSQCEALQQSPVKNSLSSTRRGFLGGTAFSLASSFIRPGYAGAESVVPLMPGGSASFNPLVEGDFEISTLIKTELARSRIQASQLSPVQQMPWDAQELYYAPFLFGAWNVTATLKRKVFPYGPKFLPSRSLLEGSPRNREEKVGNTVAYPVHYFSTLANTLKNQATVQLGLGVPESKIIQDRSFNAISVSAAYQQFAVVQDVEWDYRKDPTKVVLTFGAGPLADDMRPLGQRRTEVFLTARQTDIAVDDSNYFATAERSRSVMLAPGNIIVSDTETTTEFRRLTDDHVTAVSRIAVYLSPNPNSREGVMWQQVGGKAVAFYDYEVDMLRKKEEFVLEDGSTQERPCVRTPKDIVQCY